MAFVVCNCYLSAFYVSLLFKYFFPILSSTTLCFFITRREICCSYSNDLPFIISDYIMCYVYHAIYDTWSNIKKKSIRSCHLFYMKRKAWQDQVTTVHFKSFSLSLVSNEKPPSSNSQLLDIFTQISHHGQDVTIGQFLWGVHLIFCSPLAKWVECLPLAQETGVQSQVKLYQKLKKMVLDASLLNLQHYKVGIMNK